MIRYFKIFMIACIAAGTFIAAAEAKDVKFELALDKDRISLGETAQLGLSFYGTHSMPAPDIGNIDGLEIRYIGPSTMMTVINGQMSSSITHMYAVLPLKIGKFQIGPFSFKLKNDTYASGVVFLEVTEEKVPVVSKSVGVSTEKLNLEDRIFLTLDIGKVTAYVNELIPVTVKLYVNRLNVSDIQLPTFAQEGFSKVEFKEPKQYKEEYGGTIYDVLEFKTNIFGTRPGDYKVGPAKIKCNVMVKKRVARTPTMGGEDPFGDDSMRDSFFQDFFTRYERHPVELKSQEAQIIVSPLPGEGAPKDFLGAIGDYQFIFNASPVKLKVGDPVTVRMDINGTGNFNTVLIPKLDDTTGFKAYEAQVKTGEHTKSFTQVLIPETDLVTQIPKAVFSYFDPAKKEYKTITQGPVPIRVEKGKDEAPSQVVGAPLPGVQTPAPEDITRDIIYIKEVPGRWARIDYGIYKGKVFGIFLGLPMIFLFSLYIVQARINRMKRDAVYAGRMRAVGFARKGLKNLRHKLKSKDPKIFYDELFKTAQGYLGNRLRIPPAGITADIVDHILVSKDIDRDILRKVKNIFESCDRARFALSAVESFRMQDDLKELQEIINYFERKII